MIAVLIKYWMPITAALGAFGVSYGIHNITSAISEYRHNAALAAQEQALNASCAKSQQITSEVSNDYQSQIAALNRRVRELKRVRPDRCVPIADPAGGRDGPASPGEHGRAHGIDAGALYDFAADGEAYRLQLIACQAFIRKERE